MTEQYEIEMPSESSLEGYETNIFSVIKKRRSTREYSSKKVPDKMIKMLIDLSIQAPSAMNLQPWSFVVIQNTSILREISDEVKKRLSSGPITTEEKSEHRLDFLSDRNFDIFYHAGTLIVICAKSSEYEKFNSECDCYMAGENLMLAATGMGLATCPIGLATDVLCLPEMSKRLGVPKNFTPVLPIIVGYANGISPHVSRNPPIIKWVK